MVDRRLSINDVNLPPDVIKGYTLEGLKELSNQDEGSFYEFFQGLDLEDVKATQHRRERIQEQNRELAVKTCEQQPKFEEMKSELRQKSTKVDELRDSYITKYEELKVIHKKRDDNAVRTKLVQAVKDVEKESDDMASDFTAGKTDLSADDFKDKFLELRQTYWTRKVKKEKFEEFLKNQRPTAAPRVPRTQPQPVVQPQNPAHSLPAHMHTQTPYPMELRRPSEPLPSTSSIPPPYASQANVSMPPGYHHQTPGYPVRPPMRPPMQHNQYAYGHRY